MTPDESRHKLALIFDDTQVAAGGSWKTVELPVPVQCKKVDLLNGVRYSDLRTDESERTEADAEKAANDVALLWTKRGYTVSQTRHSEFGHQVRAINSQNSEISFLSSPHGFSLLGGSDCVDGDLGEIIHQLPDPTTGIEDLE